MNEQHYVPIVDAAIPVLTNRTDTVGAQHMFEIVLLHPSP